MKRQDLTGQTFGEWLVLYYVGNGRYHCKCSCGVEKDILRSSLIHGESTSCGHTRLKRDLTGQTFGELTALRHLGYGIWECLCSCGNIIQVRGFDLEHHNITSCGHNKTKLKDMIGKKYGEWTVLDLSDKKRYLTCKCECGTVKDVAAYSLISGRSTNCGCKRGLDLVGKKFGDLTVIGRDELSGWICKCSCGNITTAGAYHLLRGKRMSCGCKATEYKRQTMLERYGDTATSRINNPRDKASIEACNNKDEMLRHIAYIKNASGNDKKPRIEELAASLGINIGPTYRVLRRLDLLDEIQHSVFGRMENEVSDFVESLGAKVDRHRKDLLNGLEIDIYIPDKKIGIEFNGTYWHSEEIKGKTYHLNKTLRAYKNGIHLIHIFEYEWADEQKRRKILDMLRRMINPSSNTIVYARRTELREVGSSESTEFLEENHLQGSINSSINYGLYYNNKLVALMTFGKPRFNKEYQWELHRLAYKNGVVVVGGADRLFKHFIKENNPTSIISYCDISKFDGHVYPRLGFKATLSDITEPNYMWVESHTNIALPRYKTMKHKLLAAGLGTPDMTENDIMENLGFIKVYDCGNLRFTWTPTSLN